MQKDGASTGYTLYKWKKSCLALFVAPGPKLEAVSEAKTGLTCGISTKHLWDYWSLKIWLLYCTVLYYIVPVHTVSTRCMRRFLFNTVVGFARVLYLFHCACGPGSECQSWSRCTRGTIFSNCSTLLLYGIPFCSRWRKSKSCILRILTWHLGQTVVRLVEFTVVLSHTVHDHHVFFGCTVHAVVCIRLQCTVVPLYYCSWLIQWEYCRRIQW